MKEDVVIKNISDMENEAVENACNSLNAYTRNIRDYLSVIVASLCDVELDDYIRTRHPASLSEGQKRRVSIAAVMAGKPEVLLLDEPTVGQDYQGLCELSDILNKIHTETQNTMITITHDKRIAKSICDRVIIINNHNIEKIGHKNLVDKFFND